MDTTPPNPLKPEVQETYRGYLLRDTRLHASEGRLVPKDEIVSALWRYSMTNAAGQHGLNCAESAEALDAAYRSLTAGETPLRAILNNHYSFPYAYNPATACEFYADPTDWSEVQDMLDDQSISPEDIHVELEEIIAISAATEAEQTLKSRLIRAGKYIGKLMTGQTFINGYPFRGYTYRYHRPR